MISIISILSNFGVSVLHGLGTKETLIRRKVEVFLLEDNKKHWISDPCPKHKIIQLGKKHPWSTSYQMGKRNETTTAK